MAGTFVAASNEHINIANADVWDFTSGSFTVMAWAKTTDSVAVIMSKIPNGGAFEGWEYCISQGGSGQNGKPSLWNGTGWASATSTINDDAWHHVVMAYDGTDCNFFKDGVADGIATHGNPNNSAEDLQIAIRAASILQYDGIYDDLRIYSREVSAAEVLTIYTAHGRDSNIHGLAGRWILREDSPGDSITGAGNVKDFSTNLRTGTGTNTPTYSEGILAFRRRIA